MTTWLDVLNDDRGVRAIYGDKTPSLGSVEIHEISMRNEGPRVMFRFDLADYPEDPPKKWADQGFNVVQVQLMLVGTLDFSLQGWSHETVIDLSLEKEGKMVRVSGFTESIRMSITSEAALITSMAAYRVEN